MNRLKAVMFKRAIPVLTALLTAACLLTACQPPQDVKPISLKG
jgi:hypothetical protein